MLEEARRQLEQGNYGRALELLEELAAQGSRPPEVLRHLAETYLHLERWAEAEATARAYLKLQSQEAEGYYLLGQALGEQGQKEAARSALTRALSLDPAHQPAQQALQRLFPSIPGESPATSKPQPTPAAGRPRSPWPVRAMGGLVVLSSAAIVAATLFPQWAGNRSTEEPKPPTLTPAEQAARAPVGEAHPSAPTEVQTPAVAARREPSPAVPRPPVRARRTWPRRQTMPPRPRSPEPDAPGTTSPPFPRPRPQEPSSEQGIEWQIPPRSLPSSLRTRAGGIRPSRELTSQTPPATAVTPAEKAVGPAAGLGEGGSTGRAQGRGKIPARTPPPRPIPQPRGKKQGSGRSPFRGPWRGPAPGPLRRPLMPAPGLQGGNLEEELARALAKWSMDCPMCDPLGRATPQEARAVIAFLNRIVPIAGLLEQTLFAGYAERRPGDPCVCAEGGNCCAIFNSPPCIYCRDRYQPSPQGSIFLQLLSGGHLAGG
ncbi:MAG TPA: tetratricopeptide repeat protein [Armatimonadetes bacterium]|nr:tetratricopeptide repeat protein [Armatimonadota bacterium]